MKIPLRFLVLHCVVLPLCAARERIQTDQVLSEIGSRKNRSEQWNDLVDKAKRKAAEIADVGRPRVVPRGARPEIIVKGTDIWINGTRVRLHDSLVAWKKAMPDAPRCDSSGGKKLGSTTCWWDQLGIEVSTSNLDDTCQQRSKTDTVFLVPAI